MTVRPPPESAPSESAPQVVAAHPGWVWWRGVNGMLYARRPKTSPPKTARAHNFTVLVARIRRAEGRMTG